MDTKSVTGESRSSTVLVLGGGLSGLSAACHLLDNGYRVSLIEKRPFLGGRAFSFKDEESGVEVDNGQHVFMGCCHYYIDFLKKIGAYKNAFMQDRLHLEVIGRDKVATLSSRPQLGDLHLLPSFLGYMHLNIKERLQALNALLSIKRIDRLAHAEELDGQSFYQWLRKHHQSERAIRNLWNLIILPTLNEDVHTASALMAIMVFQEGLLKSPKEATIGLSKVGLTSLAGEPAARYIEERGGGLVMGTAATSIQIDQGKVQGIEVAGGSLFVADYYVSALPFDILTQLLPTEVAQDSFFSRASKLDFAPIVGVHLWYDRHVMDGDMAGFVDSPLQFIFNKSRIQGQNDGPGQYLCISLSGAWPYNEMSKSEVRDLFVREMEAHFPRAKGAKLERVLVVKQPQATFRSVPGSGSHRLPQRTPIPNLFVAGEWTDTGWPSTMEGAVRSGTMAAEALAARDTI